MNKPIDTSKARLAAALLREGITVEILPNGDVRPLHNLTQEQQTKLAAIIAAHDPRPRKPRALPAILTDVQALTPPQKTTAIEWLIAKGIKESNELAGLTGIPREEVA